MAGPYLSSSSTGAKGIGQSADTKVLTPALITNESLYRLKNNLLVARLANRTYNAMFQNEQPGDTITIKKPFYYTLPDDDPDSGNRALGDEDYSEITDGSLTIKIDKRIRGALQFVDADRMLSIDDFGNRYLQPVVEEMAEKIEEDGMAELVGPGAAGSESAGALYVRSSTADAFIPKTAQEVREIFSLYSIPDRNNYCIINPGDFISISENLRDVNTSLPAGKMLQTMVTSRYKGMMADFNVFISNKIPKYTTVAKPASSVVAGVTIIDGTGTGNDAGYSAITMDGSSSGKISKGTYFTVAGVYERKLRGNREVTDRLFTFRAVEDATSANAGGTAWSVKVKPFSVNNREYPCVSVLPADGNTYNIIAGSSTKQQYFWCRDAFEMLNLQLPTPDAAVKTGTKVDPMTGISMTYVEDYEINTLKTKLRIDAVYAFKLLRPELCVVNFST